jgi:putative transposase
LWLEPEKAVAQVVVLYYVIYMENNKYDYQRDEHRVHLIVYHLVWTSKRRKAVLVNAIADECRQLIEQKCQEHG